MKSKYICLLFGVMVFGCSSNNNSSTANSPLQESDLKLPEHIQGLENVIVISPQDFPSDNASIHLDHIFTETEDIYFGYAGNIAVDDLDRLYIQIGAEMGQVGLLVFNSDGSFEKRLGRYGRGPGEFERIQEIQIYEDRLFVYENFEVHVFNLSDLSFSHSFVIRMENLESDSELRGLQPEDNFFALSDSSFLFMFEPNLRQRVNIGEDFIYYTFLSSDGYIQPNAILKQRDFAFYNQSEDGSLPRPLPFAMPYTPSSLTAISNEERIFSAWNEDFLIKIYDFSGNYLESIYIPVQAASLPRESALNLTSNERRDVLEDAELPDSWPVIHRMHVDDQNRLWAATITENDSTFKWYVFDKELNPMGTFILKESRAERQVWFPQDLIIKNNYLYQIQPNRNREPAKIHRYKVEFDEE
jgi:hypothetical protein